MTAPPLIELQDVRKGYGGGETPYIDVLKGVSLRIEAGDFVAIVGSSGSGKSTLMNILGCLDRPSGGQYRFAGQDVSQLDSEALARLRREAFGFVFQSYHLIPSASALENVEVPALYAGIPVGERSARASALLQRLGLASRSSNRPHQLSGGQQQRVSIARALMNGGHIILADEPTGALDSQSGEQVMAILDELAAEGHVIILITHDHQVAARAARVIEIRDGEIVADHRQRAVNARELPAVARSAHRDTPPCLLLAEGLKALRSAWHTLWRNRLRTLLTLLGIVIGVASVVVMLAVGEGSKRRVMAQLGAFGSNVLYLSGRSPSPRAPEGVVTLEDVKTLATLPQVRLIMPVIGAELTVRHGNRDMQAYVGGTSADFSEILNWPVASGRYFSRNDEARAATVAVIGDQVRRTLFDGRTPLGQPILIENIPFQVIGVLTAKGASSGDQNADNHIAVPYSTASIRLLGQYEPKRVIITAADSSQVQRAGAAIERLMLRLHQGRADFELNNDAALIQAEAHTQSTLSLLLGAIAAISLLVGGIGVMNVMLMTVRERTREIGIRVAVGARQRDVLRQFLTEAGVLALMGGLLGLALALVIGGILHLAGVALVFTVSAILGAFGCALFTGILFGFMPARQAARLEPVVALTSG